MKLSVILEEYELDSKDFKLVRHSGKEFREIYQMGQKYFEAYQCEQGNPVFDNCKYILSFVATEKTYCRFIGCFEVGSKCEGEEKLKKMPEGFPFPEMFEHGVYYNLTPVELLSKYKDRLIIDWGGATVSWCQKASNDKEIIALYPQKNYRDVKAFSSYEDVILSFNELETIIQDPLTYDDWHAALSNVNGIYLILDKETGNQYIGSTYNQNGIWGRWECYANTKDGGNDGLKNLLKEKPNAYLNFQYTILKILPKSITAEEAINIESSYKEKLGTRVYGLNMN